MIATLTPAAAHASTAATAAAPGTAMMARSGTDGSASRPG